MVCLDARLPDVDVPDSQKANSSLNLIFNLNFRRPIEINEDAISATLAFNGRPHKCRLPFEAVWAIYDPNMKNGQVWEESIPEDMNLADQAASGMVEQTAPAPKPAAKPENKLKSLKTSGKSSAEAKPSAEGTPKTPRDRSHLRVIK